MKTNYVERIIFSTVFVIRVTCVVKNRTLTEFLRNLNWVFRRRVPFHFTEPVFFIVNFANLIWKQSNFFEIDVKNHQRAKISHLTIFFYYQEHKLCTVYACFRLLELCYELSFVQPSLSLYTFFVPNEICTRIIKTLYIFML